MGLGTTHGCWNGPYAGFQRFLLVHSDCDGVIHPQHGVHLADRLEQLLPLLDESVRRMQEETGRFIDGLRKGCGRRRGRGVHVRLTARERDAVNWPWAVVTCVSVICVTMIVVAALVAVGIIKTGKDDR